MADGEIRINVILDDNNAEKGIKTLESSLKSLSGVSSVFGKLGSAVGTFGKSFSLLSGIVGSAGAKITAGIGLIVVAYSKLYEASKQNFTDNLEIFGEVFSRIGSVASTVMSGIVDTFSQVTGLETGLSSLIASAIEFESAMARVSAVMGVTGQGIETITNSAREYGATTRYTATEVAEAYRYMGRQTCSVMKKFIA